MARVPASKQTRKRLTELFNGRGATEGDGSELVKLAARLIVEEALEEEVEDVVGRGYYAHGDGSGGHRNGYRRGKLDTAEGRIEYRVPQVRGTAEPFRSAIREALGSRTEELERLAIEMYARGCPCATSRRRLPTFNYPHLVEFSESAYKLLRDRNRP